MAFTADYATSPNRLTDLLRAAQKPSRVILSKILDEACTRIPNLAQSAKGRIVQLADLGAWNEVAFALIDLELPEWKIRRLVHENGEWLCSLSRQPNLPITLDDCAEATHDALPLAILHAFLEACYRRRQLVISTGSRIQEPMGAHVVCCDNFG